MTFSRMRSLAQNEMSLKNTEEKKISIQFSNEIKSSQYNFIKLPLELIVPRINYLDINELLQQQNVIFRRLLSALNIDRRHFSGSHAIARPKFSRRVNSNTPQNFILPGLKGITFRNVRLFMQAFFHGLVRFVICLSC